jgi:hypothetical protein
MIQWGARNDFPPEARKVFQSERLWGAKSLVFLGQLFLSVFRLTSKQFVHFTIEPAE